MQIPYFIRGNNSVLARIDLRQVICLFTEGNYTKVFMTGDTYFLIRATLSSTFKKLPQDMFVKVNRKLVASIFYIDTIYKDHLIIQEKPIPIGKDFYPALIEKLNIIE